MLPRRPTFTMSPSAAREVGSPTSAMSGSWPFAAIHSSTRTVPSRAGPSSSPVISRERLPGRDPLAARKSVMPATKAAMPPFMSQAPRP